MPDAPKVETKVNLIVSRSCQNHRGEKGRGEIGGVHLPSQLVQHNFAGDGRSQSTCLYRVPQCMSPRRNWDSPIPSPPTL